MNNELDKKIQNLTKIAKVKTPSSTQTYNDKFINTIT